MPVFSKGIITGFMVSVATLGIFLRVFLGGLALLQIFFLQILYYNFFLFRF